MTTIQQQARELLFRIDEHAVPIASWRPMVSAIATNTYVIPTSLHADLVAFLRRLADAPADHDWSSGYTNDANVCKRCGARWEAKDPGAPTMPCAPAESRPGDAKDPSAPLARDEG